MFIGIDESNNGRTPLIVVAVASELRKDILECKGLKKYRKKNGNMRSLYNKMAKRDYKFLLIEAQNPKDIKNVVPRIYQDLLFPSLNKDKLEVFIDGDQKGIEEILRFPGVSITIHYGHNLDTKIPLVNIADGVANYIYHKYEKFGIDGLIRKENFKKHLVGILYL